MAVLNSKHDISICSRLFLLFIFFTITIHQFKSFSLKAPDINSSHHIRQEIKNVFPDLHPCQKIKSINQTWNSYFFLSLFTLSPVSIKNDHFTKQSVIIYKPDWFYWFDFGFSFQSLYIFLFFSFFLSFWRSFSSFFLLRFLLFSLSFVSFSLFLFFISIFVYFFFLFI